MKDVFFKLEQAHRALLRMEGAKSRESSTIPQPFSLPLRELLSLY
jgi:hypothetical protein